MPIVMRWMKLISIPMADTYCLAAMTLLLKFGIWGKAIYYTHYMDMKDHHNLLPFHLVETSLLLVELMLLLWFGKATLKKPNRNSLRILEQKQALNSQKLEFHKLIKKDPWLVKNLLHLRQSLKDLQLNQLQAKQA